MSIRLVHDSPALSPSTYFFIRQETSNYTASPIDRLVPMTPKIDNRMSSDQRVPDTPETELGRFISCASVAAAAVTPVTTKNMAHQQVPSTPQGLVTDSDKVNDNMKNHCFTSDDVHESSDLVLGREADENSRGRAHNQTREVRACSFRRRLSLGQNKHEPRRNVPQNNSAVQSDQTSALSSGPQVRYLNRHSLVSANDKEAATGSSQGYFFLGLCNSDPPGNACTTTRNVTSISQQESEVRSRVQNMHMLCNESSALKTTNVHLWQRNHVSSPSVATLAHEAVSENVLGFCTHTNTLSASIFRDPSTNTNPSHKREEITRLRRHSFTGIVGAERNTAGSQLENHQLELFLGEDIFA